MMQSSIVAQVVRDLCNSIGEVKAVLESYIQLRFPNLYTDET